MPLEPNPFFTYLPEAVALADRERRITWVNDAFVRLFGWEPEEIIGKSTAQLYADPAEFEAKAQRYSVDAPLDPLPYRVHYRRADGEPFLATTSGGPLVGDAGEVLGFVGIIRASQPEGQRLDLLGQVVSISSDGSVPIEERFVRVLELGARHFGLPLGIISRVTGDTYEVVHVRDPSGAVHPGLEMAVGDTYCSQALEASGAVGFHHAGSVLHDHPCYQRQGLESYIGCAIRVDDEVFGTVNFSRRSACTPFTHDDFRVVELMASWIGHAIALDTRQRELEHLARTDPLTGLPNRFHTLELLGAAIARTRTDDEPLAVLWADLDRFKRINDTHGHDVGDLALQHFARVCRPLVRATDQVGRVGGEEFLFLLPGANADQASEIADRLLDGLISTPLLAGNARVTVTASFGVAEVRPKESTSDLLRRADAAMYEAKRAGRARSAVAT